MKTARFVRLTMVTDRRAPYDETRATSPETIVEITRPLLKNAAQEYFFVFALDVKNRINAVQSFHGGSSAVAVCVADVFRFALVANAYAVIVAHNHPSGDPRPSPEDVALTLRLSRAADVLGLKFLDHVVIGEDGNFQTIGGQS